METAAAMHLTCRETDPAEAADEVFDHAVGVRVVRIEAVEFAVGRQVDAGVLLGGDDHRGGVDDGLLAGQGLHHNRFRRATLGKSRVPALQKGEIRRF
jgi:hypothetical protein